MEEKTNIYKVAENVKLNTGGSSRVPGVKGRVINCWQQGVLPSAPGYWPMVMPCGALSMEVPSFNTKHLHISFEVVDWYDDKDYMVDTYFEFFGCFMSYFGSSLIYLQRIHAIVLVEDYCSKFNQMWGFCNNEEIYHNALFLLTTLDNTGVRIQKYPISIM